MASVRHLEFEKFRFLSNIHPRNVNFHLLTEFDRNRIIHDMDIKIFSKWRPSAILSLRKLLFWSRDQYLHVILHLLSEIRITRQYGAEI